MRLVDADLLEKDGFTVQTQEYGSVDVVSLDCIADAPTVEAAPVVHGRWIKASNKPGASAGMKCSRCKARISYSECNNGNHLFCHKCGARMDGEEAPHEH